MSVVNERNEHVFVVFHVKALYLCTILEYKNLISLEIGQNFVLSKCKGVHKERFFLTASTTRHSFKTFPRKISNYAEAIDK